MPAQTEGDASGEADDRSSFPNYFAALRICDCRSDIQNYIDWRGMIFDTPAAILANISRCSGAVVISVRSVSAIAPSGI